jgi:hypothetical protein
MQAGGGALDLGAEGVVTTGHGAGLVGGWAGAAQPTTEPQTTIQGNEWDMAQPLVLLSKVLRSNTVML